MKAQITEKHGKKEFAVMPYKDLLRLQEEVEDYHDLRDLCSAKADPQNRQGRPVDLSQAFRSRTISTSMSVNSLRPAQSATELLFGRNSRP